jgi:tRNA (mo5U34)-methyltransferase
VVADFMTTDLASLGRFDVVIFSGVLYHLQDPLGALRRLASVAGEIALVETAAIHAGELEGRAICEFYEDGELNGDPTNWWAPNGTALAAMCRAAGFGGVELLDYPPTAPERQYRLVAHAFALMAGRGLHA